MKPIEFHPEARIEFDEAMKYIESQRKGYGKRLREAVNAALSRIRRNPELYARYGESDARECIIERFHYAVYYVDLNDRIWIAAVAHGSRRPGYWRNRTPEDIEL